jgi:hypothetical protein
LKRMELPSLRQHLGSAGRLRKYKVHRQFPAVIQPMY